MKSKKPAIAVFAVIHALIIADFVTAGVLLLNGKAGNIVISLFTYIVISFLQIALSIIDLKKYNIAQVVLLIILALFKASFAIFFETLIDLYLNSYTFAEDGIEFVVAASYVGLCGLLCLAEIIAPIVVLIRKHIKPKVAEQPA